MIKIISGDISYDIDRSILMKSPYFESHIARWQDNTTDGITIPTDLTDGFIDYVKYLRNSNYIPKNKSQECLDNFFECITYFGSNLSKQYIKTHMKTIHVKKNLEFQISNQSIYLRNLRIEVDDHARYIFKVDDQIIYEYAYSANKTSYKNIVIGGIEMCDTLNRFTLPQDILDILNIRLQQPLKVFSIKVIYVENTLPKTLSLTIDGRIGVYNTVSDYSDYVIHLTYDTYESDN